MTEFSFWVINPCKWFTIHLQLLMRRNVNLQAVISTYSLNVWVTAKTASCPKLRGVWVLADCSVTCVCFHCDADMSVMHVSWSRRWDQGEEEDGRSPGHVRRHVRKRGVHLSRLWGGRPGRASVRRQHRLTSVQIDKGETSRKQHQRNYGHVSAACCFFFFPFFSCCFAAACVTDSQLQTLQELLSKDKLQPFIN